MLKIEHLIIILLIIVIYFNASNNMEHYTTLWTDFSKANQNLINTQCTALSGNIAPNNRLISKNFGNFGIIGKYPSIPVCENCGIHFDCVNYPYTDVDDKNTNVCSKCNKNYNNMNPAYVYARTAGRPRVCKRLN